MRPIDELSYYDVLEIPRDAEPEDVERAYRLTRAAWGENSLASYSLYDDRQAAEIRERVEIAYRVLSDADARRAYDEQSTAAGEFADTALRIDFSLPGSGAGPPEVGSLDAFVEGEDLPFDGPRLRRARLQRGLDLEQIAEATKINPTYLRCLEEERFDGLPARVYVRGFVGAYARCIGLDPVRVTASFMERFQQARPPAVTRPRGSR